MLKEKLNVGIIAREYNIPEDLIVGMINTVEKGKIINYKLASIEYKIEEEKLKEMFEGVKSVLSKYLEENKDTEKIIEKPTNKEKFEKSIKKQKENKKTKVSDEELVDAAIEEIEKCLTDMIGKNTIEKTNIAKKIVKKVKEIKKLPVSLEQSRKVNVLLQTKRLVNANMYKATRKEVIDSTNGMAYILADKVEEKLKNIDDIEQLKELRKNLMNLGYCERNYRILDVKSKISEKIFSLGQKQAYNEIINSTSEEIIKLAENIAMGNISSEEANKIIELQAQKEYENNNKLNVEQHRKRIEFQAKKRLESLENYTYIQDKDKVADIIEQVVNISRKSAEQLVGKISKESETINRTKMTLEER